jgi:hypothetical protein
VKLLESNMSALWISIKTRACFKLAFRPAFCLFWRTYAIKLRGVWGAEPPKVFISFVLFFYFAFFTIFISFVYFDFCFFSRSNYLIFTELASYFFSFACYAILTFSPVLI